MGSAISSSSALSISKPVGSWDIADTATWLNKIGLGQYASVFEQNEISGPILLEVGLDDLDYMSIRVLAHRKLLLKGIEDLKQNGRPTLDLKAASSPTRLPVHGPLSAAGGDALPQRRSAGSGEADEGGSSSSSSRVGSEVAEPKNKGGGAVHWSQAKPLSENKVDGSSTSDMVNLADGSYNEAAQRREFQAAVMAWRTGSVSTNFGTGGPETDTPRDDGMWHNPGGAHGKASEAGTGTGTGTDTSTSLLEGQLDEAAEHEEFARAAAASRSGGGGGGGASSSSSSSSTATATTSAGTEAPKSPTSTQAIAEQLAKQMDAGFQDQSSALAAMKKEATERLRQQEAELRAERAERAQRDADAAAMGESSTKMRGEEKGADDDDDDDGAFDSDDYDDIGAGLGNYRDEEEGKSDSPMKQACILATRP